MRRFLIFLLLAIGLYQSTPLGCGKVFAQGLPEDNLQFSVDGGKIYFFQPKTGRIFVYQTTTNRFNRLLFLEKLGEDLKQSRSISSIEEEKEEEE